MAPKPPPPPPPPQPAQRSGVQCPRCESNNTKFCYYNNYSLSQPRHFCKTCRRYWTQGGSLRNIPLGGASRKIKKPSTSSSSSAVIDHLAGPSPAVDFQVAGSGFYPTNLSPFGDHHHHQQFAAGGGGPLLDLLRGFHFSNSNNDNYWKQHQQQPPPERIALPLLYGSGGRDMGSKDNNYQKGEVGPADGMNYSKPILLFGEYEEEATNPHSYHDNEEYEQQQQQMMTMSTPPASAAAATTTTTEWLFGGGQRGGSSSSSHGYNNNNKEIEE